MEWVFNSIATKLLWTENWQMSEITSFLVFKNLVLESINFSCQNNDEMVKPLNHLRGIQANPHPSFFLQDGE